MAALPAPAEFSGPVPSPTEVNRLLEVLVQLPPNLHSLVSTAVRLFGGSMNGTPAAAAAAAAAAVRARAGPAGAVESDSAGGAGAAVHGRAEAVVDGPVTRLTPSPPLVPPPLGLDVKPEPVSVRAGASASGPSASTALAGTSAAMDDSDDSAEDAPAFRRKRAGDNDLYLQRLHKKQNAQP
jgi:hypothetical protein